MGTSRTCYTIIFCANNIYHEKNGRKKGQKVVFFFCFFFKCSGNRKRGWRQWICLPPNPANSCLYPILAFPRIPSRQETKGRGGGREGEIDRRFSSLLLMMFLLLMMAYERKQAKQSKARTKERKMKNSLTEPLGWSVKSVTERSDPI